MDHCEEECFMFSWKGAKIELREDSLACSQEQGKWKNFLDFDENLGGGYYVIVFVF